MVKFRRQKEPSSRPQEVAEIPIGVRRAASWSWRLIVIAVAAILVGRALLYVPVLVLSVLVAILLAVLLMPVVRVLTRYTFLGRGASTAVAMLGLILVVIGMFWLAGRQLIAQWPDIQQAAITGFQTITSWAAETFQLQTPNIDAAIDEALSQVQQNAQTLLSGALSTATFVGSVLTGIVVTLFALFFFLASGHIIWRWIIGLLPPDARIPTHESVRRGWKALSAYVFTQILVAAVDATGIALGIAFLGLAAYAVPIWLIVFLFSFVPIVGAIVSGAIAVLLVLVLQSFPAALIMLAIVLAVQQIEGNVLQPFLMGRAVALHPLAVFLGVAAGATIAGIPGALFSIPVLAFVNATLLYVTGRDPSPELEHDTTMAEHFKEVERQARRNRAQSPALS